MDGHGSRTGPNAVLDRLATQFGEAAIRPLVERFSVMLSEAIASLDAGEGRAVAHRVAGVAGTLGFSALGRSWLALAEGDESGTVSLRGESARAIRIVAERYPNSTADKTSV